MQASKLEVKAFRARAAWNSVLLSCAHCRRYAYYPTEPSAYCRRWGPPPYTRH